MTTAAGRTLRAATAHISPVILSSHHTTQKVIQHIHKASRQQANLLCFPEAFIPAFPVWSAFHAPTETHHLFHRISQESIYADGDEIKAIQHAAAKAQMVISIGISEKVRYSTATLFNSNLILGTDGRVLVHHRKLMPTWFEKLTWSPGDGHGLRIADTEHGKIGALICGENTNPLARYTMMAQGEQVHISSWPAVWPSRTLNPDQSTLPSSSSSTVQTKNYDNITANRTRAAAHSFEAKCFGIMCAPHLSPTNIETLSNLSPNQSLTTQILSSSPRAASMFLDPTGAPLPGFTVDEDTGEKRVKEYLQNEEGVLYADMNLELCVEGKQFHDVVGGYQRLDVFELKVDRSRRGPVTFTEGEGGASR